MLTAASSVIVFILVLLVVAIILYSMVFVRSRNNEAHVNAHAPAHAQAGAEIPMEKQGTAQRLDPGRPNTATGDPRGIDVGGNYTK